ncbi:hypothetical protein BKA70DRAFT_1225966 [Coprinopsis sp. MPI-PUGE-AT-0042]|nr:hypothetical protein BKA70DRAFT_1225966 [Coprinopsis sp. MPI-PUGE-AT-0042]
MDLESVWPKNGQTWSSHDLPKHQMCCSVVGLATCDCGNAVPNAESVLIGLYWMGRLRNRGNLASKTETGVGSWDLGSCSDSPPRIRGKAVLKAELILIGPYQVCSVPSTQHAARSREHGTERGIGPDQAQPRESALESREFGIKTEVGLGDAGSGSNSDSALGFWMEVGSQDLGKVNNTPIIESFKGYLHLPENLTWGSVLRLTTQDPRESGTESGIGPDRSLPSGSAQAAWEFGIKTEVGQACTHIWTRPWGFGWESGVGT